MPKSNLNAAAVAGLSFVVALLLTVSLVSGCSSDPESDGGQRADGGIDDAADAATDVAADGSASSMTIGPEGGAVTSPDGLLTLAFPPGALAEPTAITIAEEPDTEPALGDRLGDHVYVLGPAGTTFDEPVVATLTAPLGESLEAGTVPLLELVHITAEGEYEALEAVDVEIDLDEETATVRGELHHFSALYYIDFGRFKLGFPAALRQGTSSPVDVEACVSLRRECGGVRGPQRRPDIPRSRPGDSASEWTHRTRAPLSGSITPTPRPAESSRPHSPSTARAIRRPTRVPSTSLVLVRSCARTASTMMAIGLSTATTSTATAPAT